MSPRRLNVKLSVSTRKVWDYDKYRFFIYTDDLYPFIINCELFDKPRKHLIYVFFFHYINCIQNMYYVKDGFIPLKINLTPDNMSFLDKIIGIL